MLIKVIIPSVSVHVWIKNGTCDILFYSNSTRISIKKKSLCIFPFRELNCQYTQNGSECKR